MHVIADYFTEGRSLNEQTRSLKGKGKVSVEDVCQINQNDLYKPYLLKQKDSKHIICRGDPNQVPPPEQANYDLSSNSSIIGLLSDGNIIELNDLPDCGRYLDNMPDIFVQRQSTKIIPGYV
jgi:hypothetical protein